MVVHVEIIKKPNENNMSVLRRFRQQVQGWSGLKRLRSIRYFKRDISSFTKKKQALRALSRRQENVRLQKLGKISTEMRGR